MFKKNLAIFIILLVSINSFGQETKWNNTVKFGFLGISSVYSLSLNYERFITMQNSIEFTGRYIHAQAYGDRSSDYVLSCIPSFRHYFLSKKDSLCHNWISIYFSITKYKYKTSYGTIFFNTKDIIDREVPYGPGFLIGRRLTHKKEKRLFLDVGAGLTFYPIYWSIPLMKPRITVLVGYKV